MTFTPTLGQIAHGNPWQRLECPERVEHVLGEIRDALSVSGLSSADCCGRYYWCGGSTPFDNAGCEYTKPVFHVESYNWSAAVTCEEDPATCQDHNFRFVLSSGREVKVSWYKRFGRGTSINCELTDAELDEMRTACLASLKGA